MFEIYDGTRESQFTHIREISCYNNNYYIGLKRDGKATRDLLFCKSDDDNWSEWSTLERGKLTPFAESFVSERDVLRVYKQKPTYDEVTEWLEREA